MLLVAPGLTTRNKKLLVTRSILQDEFLTIMKELNLPYPRMMDALGPAFGCQTCQMFAREEGEEEGEEEEVF